jgi:RNA polymerase primary sigma factor
MIAYAAPKSSPLPRHAALLDSLSPADRALVQEALSVPLAFIPSPRFDDPDAERALFDDGPPITPVSTSWYHPQLDMKPSRAAPRAARLTPEQERHLFLRYNFARSHTILLVGRFRARPSVSRARSIALWYGRVKAARDLLARANLALVLAMARRVRVHVIDFGDLVSEGNMALLRSIDAFDVNRGFKFSTYACRAILKAYGRLLARAGRYRAFFPTEFDPALECSDHRDVRLEQDHQDILAELRQVLLQNRAKLSRNEQTVLQSRFALDAPQLTEAMTLEEVGRVMGVTKECVRQIQNKALAKLRSVLEFEALAN